MFSPFWTCNRNRWVSLKQTDARSKLAATVATEWRKWFSGVDGAVRRHRRLVEPAAALIVGSQNRTSKCICCGCAWSRRVSIWWSLGRLWFLCERMCRMKFIFIQCEKISPFCRLPAWLNGYLSFVCSRMHFEPVCVHIRREFPNYLKKELLWTKLSIMKRFKLLKIQQQVLVKIWTFSNASIYIPISLTGNNTCFGIYIP